MIKAITIDPRNEGYRFNLANLYLANREPDKAVEVLEALQKNASPEMTSRVASVLERVHEVQQVSTSPVGLVHRDGAESSTEPAVSPSPAPESQGPKWGSPIFLQGVIRAVDCSAEPSALLTISSGSKAVKLKIADKKHVILIGADQFSCDWAKKKVAVNYRQSEAGDTSVMSVELQ